jgi:hypothetical protein
MERQNLKHDSMPRSDWVSPKLTWVGDLKAIVRGGGGKISALSPDAGDPRKPSGQG